MANRSTAGRVAEPELAAPAARQEPRLDIGITIGKLPGPGREFEVALIWREPATGKLCWQAQQRGKNGALGEAERLVRALEDFVIWSRLPKGETNG